MGHWKEKVVETKN